MKLRSYAKINLTLDILGKRQDGYHDIDTIFQHIDLYDEIDLQYTTKGITIKCNVKALENDENIAYKAALLLKEKFNIHKGAEISINKKIPVGAGLSGGSSNAAAVLKGLNIMWNLGLSKNKLIEIAKEIGMDVAFHIIGGTCHGSARGENIEKLSDISKKYMVVVYPGFGVNTKEAYAGIDYTKVGKTKSTPKFIENYDLSYLHNDFEYSILNKYPELKEIKGQLGKNSLLSGSGSCFFGVYSDMQEAKKNYDKLKTKYKQINLAETINKRIETAKEMGYCFGVKRAIEEINKLAGQKNIYILGKLIHNPQVVASLEEKGLQMVDTVDNIKQGTVVITAHGNTDKTISKIKDKGLRIINLTCPLVSNVHNITKGAEKRGRKIIVYGDKEHTEVKGIVGNLKNYKVITNVGELTKEDLNCDLTLVSQTTREVEMFNSLAEKIKKIAPNVEVKDTICIATKDRQESAVSLAKKSQLMIIIGGKISSNTKRLAEICSKYTKTRHVETANEIKMEWFNEIEIIGITAGASTPDLIIDDIKKRIEMII